VTMMTNYLSNSPNFTYTSLPVAPYQNAPRADQPGGSITTVPNTTITQVQYHNGHLVTAMASGLEADGFTYPKGLFYQIDVSGSSPTLLQQGVVDPGTGVAVQMPSADEDKEGNVGLTWMESSSTEFLSMWVGIQRPAGWHPLSRPLVVGFSSRMTGSAITARRCWTRIRSSGQQTNTSGLMGQ
jgi:hypothetical protein